MKRIKTFFKKYYFPILTEIIILCIIFTLGSQIVSSEKRSIDEDIDTRQFFSGGITERDGEFIEDTFFRHVLSNFVYWSGSHSQKRNSCNGMAARLYDSDGNVIAESPSRLMAVEWIPDVLDPAAPEQTIFFLEKYFPEDALDKLLKTLQRKSGTILYSMTGYRDSSNKFIPVELVFRNANNKKWEYKLVNEDFNTEGQIPETRYFNYWEEELPASTKNHIIASGGMPIHFFNTRPEITKRAWEVFEEECPKPISPYDDNVGVSSFWHDKEYTFTVTQDIWDTDSGMVSFSIVSCVDTKTQAWIYSCRNTQMIPLALLCQGLGIILIAIYVSLQKKQHKLNEMRGTFLNAIAHEMKTPAAVIKNSSECIQAGIHPEKQEHYLNMIEKEADHMNQLLNNMLVYTRTSEAGYLLKPENCNIEILARNVFRHYETLVQQKHIKLQWNATGSRSFFCDEKLMKMVLDNFFSNAVKFCPEHQNITITIKENEFRIFNSGTIFSDADKKQIWEPLFKKDTSRTTAEGSSGMGLAIAASILELHHAVYGVENKSYGVEFYFKL